MHAATCRACYVMIDDILLFVLNTEWPLTDTWLLKY